MSKIKVQNVPNSQNERPSYFNKLLGASNNGSVQNKKIHYSPTGFLNVDVPAQSGLQA